MRRRIHPELVEAYEEWLAGVIEAAEAFEGHQGAQVLRPPNPATQDYVLLFRYATPEQLAAWQESATARDWLKRGEAFTGATCKSRRSPDSSSGFRSRPEPVTARQRSTKW
ncbi:MAG: hypothetical protein F6K00_05835 [Leptolyngbya sp. SIOISBB]|nr:hypothetical protein [Leptolyngbya sp. SIOISBB]